MPPLPEPIQRACPMCGYDLSAIPLVDGFLHCPECGMPWGADEMHRGKPAPVWLVCCAHVFFGLGGAVVGGLPTLILCGLWLVSDLLANFGNQPGTSFAVIVPFLAVPGVLWVGLMLGALFAFRRIFSGAYAAKLRRRVRRHLLFVVLEQIAATIVLAFLLVKSL